MNSKREKKITKACACQWNLISEESLFFPYLVTYVDDQWLVLSEICLIGSLCISWPSLWPTVPVLQSLRSPLREERARERVSETERERWRGVNKYPQLDEANTIGCCSIPVATEGPGNHKNITTDTVVHWNTVWAARNRRPRDNQLAAQRTGTHHVMAKCFIKIKKKNCLISVELSFSFFFLYLGCCQLMLARQGFCLIHLT